MARPYSLDLRERVIARIEAGETRTAAAAHFAISAPSAIRWAQRKRDTGDIAARPMGGKRPLSLAPHRDWLLARMKEKPDLTLRAILAELIERGIPASYGAVQRFFKAERISFKKTLHASEQDRPDVARRRLRWRRYQARVEPSRLVFIDETPAFAGAGSGPRPT